MINIIVELSKYVILTLMIVYTFHCFYMVRRQDQEERREMLTRQLMLIFFIDFTAFLVIYLKTFDFSVILFYVEMMVYFALIQILYRIIYKNASLLLLNNMCMLLSIGCVMLCRLDIKSANKQLLIVAAGSVVTKGTVVESGWVYAGTPAKKMKQLGEELLKGEVERIVNAYSMYASWYEDENQKAE